MGSKGRGKNDARAAEHAPVVDLISASRDLSLAVGRLRFGPPVTHVYNPLEYAWRAHEAYLTRYGNGTRRVLLVGMNPGPFGMAQTGVPFGDVAMVRDFLGIHTPVGKPAVEHPRRVVQGFDCPRCEISGTRLWGWARNRFGTPDAFFRTFFVANYCPLVFIEESARNRTPDKLPAAERAQLFDACDEALRRVVDVLQPDVVVGVGGFAERRAREALHRFTGTIGGMLHPSPASPLANRNWAQQAERDLGRLGVELP
jgi:single-strand selective monofunctional uracil DNA glycosylase